MSFQEQLSAAIAAVRTYAQIDNLSRELWAAHAARVLDDDCAQAAAELLHARKRALRADPRPAVQKAFCAPPRRRAPRSPDRAKSIARRRACATSGAVPSRIAASFTQGEVAVMAVIAAEVKRSGRCDWPVDRIAAQAGVCHRLAQLALRDAAELGLISIEERPRPGAKSLTNVVTVISPEWRAWLRLGDDRVKKSASHGNYLSNSSATLRGPIERGSAKGWSGEAPPSRPDARGPVERHDRLEVTLRRAEAILAEKARAITG